MKVTVNKIDSKSTLVEVHTATGIEEIKVERTDYGYSYTDYSDFNITENEYYALEEFMDNLTSTIRKEHLLDIEYL
jgi:translation elongation factor P/translation initiation factor 5A